MDTPQAVKRMRMYTPRTSRIADITGLAVSVDRLLKKVAPAKAPIAPGTAILAHHFPVNVTEPPVGDT